MYLSNEEVAARNWHIHVKTVKLRLISLLAYGNGRWICGTAFLENYMPTYSQRIGELVKDGYAIERGRCKDPGHYHRGQMAAYRFSTELVEDSE